MSDDLELASASRPEPVLRPDQEPGFWCEFIEPRSDMARAVQFPIPDGPWAGRVVNAYLSDDKRARRKLALADATKKETP